MKITCDYCSNTYEDTLPKCPYCNAPNPTQKTDKNPRTIEELQAWYTARHLPAPEKTRFFIGVDYKGAKAFGIYKNENGEFIVYKNKADGSRAVRYLGKDETYAVNEIFQKLKDEIVHQKNSSRKSGKSSGGKRSGRGNDGSSVYMWITLIAIAAFLITLCGKWITGRHNGYYSNHGNTYYHYGTHWYTYDDYGAGSWTEIYDDPVTEEIEGDYDGYYLSRDWDSSIQASDWDDSPYYDEMHYDSDSSDSDWGDYDWDSSDSWDSWDSGSDWDSDW